MHFSFLLFKITYTHMRKKNVFIFQTAFFYSIIKQNFHLLKRGAFSDVVDAVFFISSLSSVTLDFSLFVNFHPLFYFSLTCCTSIFIYFFSIDSILYMKFTSNTSKSENSHHIGATLLKFSSVVYQIFCNSNAYITFRSFRLSGFFL